MRHLSSHRLFSSLSLVMFIDLPLPPPAIVQVVEDSSEGVGLGALWDVTGWIFVIPMLEGDQPYMGNNPLTVVDKDGVEVELSENSYKIPGLLKYEDPDYFIIMDQEAFFASEYRLALKEDEDAVIIGTAAYTENTETTNRFESSNTSPSPQVLNFEKLDANVLVVGSQSIQSQKTEVRDTSEDNLRVEAEVSSEELKIPESPTTYNLPATTYHDIKSPLLREAVAYLVERGIINGYPDGTFQPDKIINRAEALKIIFAAQGIAADRPAIVPPFPDVSTTEWFAVYVEEAKSRKLIKGYPDGTYRPQQEVNKAEFLKIAVSAQSFVEEPINYSSALTQFSDLDKSQWYMPFVTYAVEHGYLDNTSKLKPTEGMSRGEAAMIIYRMLRR